MRAILLRIYQRRRRDQHLLEIVFAVLFLSSLVFQWMRVDETHPVGARLLEVLLLGEHVEGAIVIIGTLLFGFYFLLSRRYGNGRLPSLGLQRLMIAPDTPNSDLYEFRIPQGREELTEFVEWSDRELDITARHEELWGAARYELYYRWFNWNKSAFMFLDRFDETTRRWRHIALSIALPLSPKGSEKLLSGDLRIIDVEQSDISSGEQPTTIIMDTWIVKQIGQRGLKIEREKHDRYAIYLLFVHAGLFWTKGSPLSLAVEADNPKVEAACDMLKFDRSRRTRDGATLQVLTYPSNAGNEIDQSYEMVVRGIEKVSHWPVTGR